MSVSHSSLGCGRGELAMNQARAFLEVLITLLWPRDTPNAQGSSGTTMFSDGRAHFRL
jgi:hypothetical protein